MNTQVSPPPSPPVAPVTPAALTGEQAQAWDTLRTTLAGGNQERATWLQTVSSPDVLFERAMAKPAESAAQPSWADIQKMLAGDDPAAQQFVSKYADPTLFTKSVLSLQNKLSEGGRVKIPGEGATPEEIAEYAKAIGVPESADKYNITAAPAKGYEVTDADKAMVGDLTKEVHELVAKGAKPEAIVNFAIQKYYDVAAQNIVASEERAADRAYEGEQANRTLWGDKYDQNIGWAIAGAKQFFPGTDEEFDSLMGTKLETGEALFDNPIIQRIFAQVGLEHAEDPFIRAKVAANTSFDPQKRIDEIKGLRLGTAAQRAEYTKLSAPGGELEKLVEGMQRNAPAPGTQRRS